MTIVRLNKSEFIGQLPPGFAKNLPAETGLFAVGGTVRDKLIPGLVPRELDILITGISPEKLIKILKSYGCARLVGKSFTVIKWYPGFGSVVDVSLPSRRGLSFPGGCEIDPELPLEEDLFQRDFTVNALAFDLISGKIHDPLGGLEDLENGLLRAVNPLSLEADPIRCLRAAYICARCGLRPDETTLDLIRSVSPRLADMAPERIGEELKKLLLELPEPSKALRLWRDWNLLEIIAPELEECVGVTQEGGWHAHDVFEHLLYTVDAAPAKLDVRLASLFHDIGKPRRRKYIKERDRAIFYGHQNLGERIALKILKRLRFSSDMSDRVGRLVRNHMFTHPETDRGVRRFVRRAGEDLLDSLFDLRFADIVAQGTDRDDTSDRKFRVRIEEVLSQKPPLSTSDLALDGEDVMRVLGISEGPLVGEVLNNLLERVLDEPGLNSRKSLMNIMLEFAESKGISPEKISKKLQK